MSKFSGKAVKRFISVVLSLSIGASICGIGTVGAADAPSVTMDKSEYKAGEAYTVTYANMSGVDAEGGDGYRWYGVYHQNETPGAPDTGVVNGFWDYFNGASGTITFSENKWNSLPAGDYKLCFFAGEQRETADGVDRYVVQASANFKIVTEDIVDPGEPTVTMDKTEYSILDTPHIEWNSISGSGPWYGVYSRADNPGAPGIGSKFWNNISAGNGTTDFSGSIGGSWSDLKVGDYKLCVFANEDKKNELYIIQAQFDFSIVRPNIKPHPPKTAEYARKLDIKNGFADGTLTITPPDNKEYMTGYAAYWGDDTAPLDGYSPIKINGITDSGKQTRTYKFNRSLYIPSGATKLYVYSASGTGITDSPRDILCSENAVAIALPAGAALEQRVPLYSFQATSDWHIFANDKNSIKARRLDAMLKDVKQTDPDSIAIIGNGDVTDNSMDDPFRPDPSPEKSNAEFDVLNAVIDDNKQDLPPVLFGLGNHDMRGGDSYAAQLKRFLERTNTTDSNGKAYRYKEIGGAKFIFLGSERSGDNGYCNAELSKTQLEWFESTLKEHATDSEPIFIFLHQPLNNTSSGTTGSFNWNGVNQDAKVRAILKKYPQAIWVSGHTHWELESRDPMYTGFGKDFSAFNDAGLGKLYDDTEHDKEGSQGLYIEVYRDRVLVRGRDFENKLWVTSAQFMLDTTLPLAEKIKKWTADKPTMLANADAIKSALTELNSISGDKGDFSALCEQLNAAKAQLDAAHSDKDDKPAPPKPVKNGWVNENGKTYYYKNGVKSANAFVTNGKSTYVTDKNGAKYTGTKFVTVKGKKYFIKSSKLVKNKTFTYKGKRYAADKKGVRLAGSRIVKIGSNRYFVNKKGVVLVKKWKRIKKKWYYAGKNGALYAKTVKKIKGKKYRFNKKCVCTNR